MREGKAEALMKGSLHTDELMGAVVRRETGLRTARRISHCFVLDVPSYDAPLIITDAAVNIAPTLADKVDIVQNAIDLAHALRFKEVRVAILSAMETVNPNVPSTIEAAALCKMADRGQITGGILDGPLALDNAISLDSVKIKKIKSPVAGRANMLIVPDLEAGNMLAKSLTFLAHADAAGIVLGARVPIILTSRADSVMARLASCAVAALIAAARREALPKRSPERSWPTPFSSSTPARPASSSRCSSRRERDLELVVRGQVERPRYRAALHSHGRGGKTVGEKRWGAGAKLGHEGALAHVVDWLQREHGGEHRLAAVGHRVVHGGDRLLRAGAASSRAVDGEAREAGAARTAAPAPQPRADPRFCRAAARSAPGRLLRHRISPNQSGRRADVRAAGEADRSRRAPLRLPRSFLRVHRFACCPRSTQRAATGRTVVFHLGNGASMCALRAG